MPDELPARSSMFVVNAPNERRLTATKDPGAIWPSLQACRFFVCKSAAGTTPSHTSQSTRERKGESRDSLEPASQKSSSFETWEKCNAIWQQPSNSRIPKTNRRQIRKIGRASCRERVKTE